MRAAIFLLALLPTAAMAADAPDSQPGCFRNGVTQADGRSGAPGVRRLDQLPPANTYLTVIRREDGCMKPVIVRYGVDGAHRGDSGWPSR
jgi:hypothetical protein